MHQTNEGKHSAVIYLCPQQGLPSQYWNCMEENLINQASFDNSFFGYVESIPTNL